MIRCLWLVGVLIVPLCFSGVAVSASTLSQNELRAQRDRALMALLNIDARWANFGEYMQEFCEITQARWLEAIKTRKPMIEPGTRVQGSLTLHADGTITDVKIEGAPDESARAAFAHAVDADHARRKWTSGMVKKLGREQRLTLSLICR